MLLSPCKKHKSNKSLKYQQDRQQLQCRQALRQAGAPGQQFRALAALTEDRGSIPAPTVTPVPGNLTPLLGGGGWGFPQAPGTGIHAGETPTHIHLKGKRKALSSNIPQVYL
jgi:glycine/D-amino acid oxidase-like deaminating enzyme